MAISPGELLEKANYVDPNVIIGLDQFLIDKSNGNSYFFINFSEFDEEIKRICKGYSLDYDERILNRSLKKYREAGWIIERVNKAYYFSPKKERD